MNSLLIKDQMINGKVISEIKLHFSSETITLKDLIESRVAAEVEIQHDNEDKPFFGLVTPTKKEELLNRGGQVQRTSRVDVEKQIYIALDGFQKNQFFVIVDDQQIDDLEYKLTISSIKEIQFLRLTQLVGG